MAKIRDRRKEIFEIKMFYKLRESIIFSIRKNFCGIVGMKEKGKFFGGVY